MKAQYLWSVKRIASPTFLPQIIAARQRSKERWDGSSNVLSSTKNTKNFRVDIQNESVMVTRRKTSPRNCMYQGAILFTMQRFPIPVVKRHKDTINAPMQCQREIIKHGLPQMLRGGGVKRKNWALVYLDWLAMEYSRRGNKLGGVERRAFWAP